MNLTKREDVLKLSGLVVARDYKTCIEEIESWLNKNPFDLNAMSEFKGNKDPNKKRNILGHLKMCIKINYSQSLKPVLVKNLKELYKLYDGKGKINGITLFQMVTLN